MNLRDKLLRWLGFWPPFLGAGIKVTRMSSDHREIDVLLKLRFWNANYIGTQFGGSLFSMADPFYMLMLIKNLGSDFKVVDKSASIRFLKLGKTDVKAEFRISENDLREIIESAKPVLEWKRTVLLKDLSGDVVAEVDKVIYIRNRNFKPTPAKE